MTRIISYPVFSPDGRRFAVVVQVPVVERDANEYRIIEFSTRDLAKAGSPKVLFRVTSRANDPAIEYPRYLSDSMSIAFLGTFHGEPAQVYSVDGGGGRLKRWTTSSSGVLNYDIANDDRFVVYAAPVAVEREPQAFPGSDAIAVASNTAAWDVITGREQVRNPTRVFLQYRSESKPRLLYDSSKNPGVKPNNYFREAIVLALSPDEKSVLINYSLPTIPAEWKAYQSNDVASAINSHLTPPTYAVIDLHAGRLRTLIDAPIVCCNSNVLWSPDSSSVVATSLLPLNIADREQRSERSSSGSGDLLEINVKTGKFSFVARGHGQEQTLSPLRWDQQTLGLVVEDSATDSRSLSTYRRAQGGWHRTSITALREWAKLRWASTNGRVIAGMADSLTIPPEIAAIDIASKKKTVLTDLNPDLRTLAFGDAEAITFKVGNANTGVGYLIKPVGYVRGRRYPAVLLIKDFDNSFIIDGQQLTTAFPAQPLAGRGFVVLLVNDDSPPLDIDESSPKEGPDYVNLANSAVNELERRDLIDPARVGIIGFSRTSWAVDYIVTHSKTQFAAATSADSGIYSYFSYLLANSQSFQTSSERQWGGGPFLGSFEAFRSNEPSLNAVNVRTPLRLEAESGVAGLLSMWELYAALRRLDKPVELIYFPHGTHLLVKPSERMASLQGNVDWFSFWLKGEEDPDPAKRAQYARWHVLRDEYCSLRPTAAICPEKAGIY